MSPERENQDSWQRNVEGNEIWKEIGQVRKEELGWDRDSSEACG